MNRTLLLFFLSLTVVACSNADYSESPTFKKDMADFEFDDAGHPSVSADDFIAVKTGDLNGSLQAPRRSSSPIPRKLIRNGSMHIQVESIDSARTQLSNLLDQDHGYVSSESANHNHYNSQSYTLRIPEAKFDNFIIAVEGISTEVLSRNINVNDVTDQYVDIAARLSTKRALHQRYTQLLSRAKNVKEVIEVERELAKVLADIESSEARLKSLGDRASYATLTLSLSTEAEPIAQAGFFSQLGESFSNGWTGVKMAVLLGATLWPLLISGLILFFGVRWVTNVRSEYKAKL